MIRRISLVVVMAFLAAACSSSAATITNSNDLPLLRAQVAGPVPGSETEAQASKAELLLAQMTTDQKIGQLFVPVVSGSDLNQVSAAERARNLAVFGVETPGQVVEKYQLGGVMYLASNVKSSSQVADFTSGLQTAASESTVPMLIAIDQEGGRINRITDGVTLAPSAAELSGDADAVRSAAETTASQVNELGVNVVLAPVGDLSLSTDPGVIGDRSFGVDPDQTAEMVRASVDGLQGSGVAAAVKHWPGHGATEIDSHVSKPSVQVTQKQWEERERVPFEAALDEDVDIVLVGHLSFPQLAPDDRVATVSNFLVDDLLREDLDYDRVVMTDALNMGAVADISQSELGVQSLEAGVDMLLFPDNMVEMHAGVVDAVDSGRISEDRLDKSVLRILSLKASLGLLDDVEPGPDDPLPGSGRSSGGFVIGPLPQPQPQPEQEASVRMAPA